MSVAAIRRSFAVVHHLKGRGEARFTDLARLLSPISRTALSHLLSSLEEIGEVERCGRSYRLAAGAASLGAAPGSTIYTLPPAVQAATHPIVERAATEAVHSCALFARVGGSTMKIMDEHNLSDPHWPFTPVGYEWPLVPFHGFARVFLAYGSASLARDCYLRWYPYLQTNMRSKNFRAFRAELDQVRRQGFAVEYREELSTILRVVAPVPLAGDRGIRFAVGFVANYVYLLELKSCLKVLRQAAGELAAVLQGRVPSEPQPETLPAEGGAAWAARPGREA